MANAITQTMCSCGKDSYPSKSSARTGAKAIARQDRARKILHKELRPYECSEHPGVWHLTHERQRKAARVSDIRASGQVGLVIHAEREFGPATGKRKPRRVPSAKPTQPKHTGPEHTSCTQCGRRWLSDLNPAGRRCPGCQSIGTVVVGWADRARTYIRAVAA